VGSAKRNGHSPSGGNRPVVLTMLIQINAVTNCDVHKVSCGSYNGCGRAPFCQSLLAAFAAFAAFAAKEPL
jgi:hypothetical protein